MDLSARREWLSWGGPYLFHDLAAEVRQEEATAAALRRAEEEEAATREKEAIKSAKVIAMRTDLEVRRATLLGAIRSKTISREEIQLRNAELKDEEATIKRFEAGEDEDPLFLGDSDDEDKIEEMPRPTPKPKGKRKISEPIVLESDIESGDELPEIHVAKRQRVDDELLDVTGPVSTSFVGVFVCLLTISQCDRCRGFLSQPKCVVEEGWAKCAKCTRESQGCYWSGMSRRGVRKGSKGGAVRVKTSGVPKPGTSFRVSPLIWLT